MRALSHSGSLLKRIALFVLWSAVLGFAVQPASAQSKADPGNNNPPPPGAILDLNGMTIPHSAYQQYSVNFVATVPNTAITIALRDDPAFLSLANVSVVDNTNPDVNLLVNGNFGQGVYTNNGNAATPIGWTYVDQYGVAFAGGVAACPAPYTPCWSDGAVQAYDAISQTIPTTVGDTYTISFYVIENSGDTTFSSLSTNGDTTDTGGNGIDVTVYAQAGVPGGAPINQNFNLSGATTATFNSNAGFLVQQTIDTSNANGALSCNSVPVPAAAGAAAAAAVVSGPCGTVTLSTTNNTVQNGVPLQQFFLGTPFYGADCASRPGDGGGCSMYENACWGGNTGSTQAQASDYYCPFINTPNSNVNYFTLKDTYDPPPAKHPITPGSTVSLVDFVPQTPTETWVASPNVPNPVCTQVAPFGVTPAFCHFSDSDVDIYGDQTTTRGTKPKKGWLMTLFNVSMLQTTVQVFPNPGTACALKGSPVVLNDPPTNDGKPGSGIWSNSACLLGFLVNPAQGPQPPSPNFVAAPPASLIYGPGNPPVAPGIPAGDFQLTNASAVCTGLGVACGAQPWETLGQATLSSIFGATDGTFTLHWAAKDAVGITEKNAVLQTSGTCTTGPAGSFNAPCYTTNYLTTIVNLDSTNPTITLTFSPAGGTYSVGQQAYANVTCSDPVAPSGAAPSGIASCQASVDGGAPVSVLNNPAVPLNTATAGAHTVTVTAVDNAGNPTTQVFNYTVLPGADVAIFEQHTSDKVKPGGTLTYLAWALDLSKTNAAEVTVTEQIQLPAAGVQLGNVTASVALVSCTFSGCTSMPPVGGAACTVSGTTISCNIGTLPSLWGWKGALIKTSIPVLNTSKVGTPFKIMATVNSPGDINPGNNSTTDLLSICSPSN